MIIRTIQLNATDINMEFRIFWISFYYKYQIDTM